MLNGKSQSKDHMLCCNSIYMMSRTGKATEAKAGEEGMWGWRWGLTANGYEVSFGVNENILDLER